MSSLRSKTVPDLIEVRATSNALEIEKMFIGAGRAASVQARAATRSAGKNFVRQVRKFASGDGIGPNVGDSDEHYRDSWGFRVFHDIGGATSVVAGTDKPQARRLEWGFTGVDSLGRYFDQAPRPHVGRALDVVEPLFAADLLERAFAPLAAGK